MSRIELEPRYSARQVHKTKTKNNNKRQKDANNQRLFISPQYRERENRENNSNIAYV
jgi:hypothetical protein